ncbi:hypothetical protein D3C87_569450 [compost metagenome]
MKHRIVWFKGLVAGAPVDGGAREEDSLKAWDLAEAFRLESGINLEAFVPIVDALEEVETEEIPEPSRALEVISVERLQVVRGETYKIKDRYGMPREIQGAEVAEWLEGYRELWQQGFLIVRTGA